MEILLGDQLRARILTTAQETDGRHDLVDAWMPAGTSTPAHRHRYAERLFVLEGELSAMTEHGHHLLGPGDFISIDAGTIHMMSTRTGSRGLNISSPAGFAELLVRAGSPAETGSPDDFDPDRFMTVSTEMGDEVFGPPGVWPFGDPLHPG